MKAIEAQEITAKSKSNFNDLDKTMWRIAKDAIFEAVKESAQKGNSSVSLDLNKNQRLGPVNKNLDKMRIELEEDGYKVEYKLVRCINGAREMIVSW